jgi:hypothetical protein
MAVRPRWVEPNVLAVSTPQFSDPLQIFVQMKSGYFLRLPLVLLLGLHTDGRTIRMLTMIDEYTRECLTIRVARRLGSYEVIEAWRM